MFSLAALDNPMNPLDADREFFAALIVTDTKELERILTDDFVLIDVMSGSENIKSVFLAFVGSGQVRFESIEFTLSVRSFQVPATPSTLA